MAFDITSKRAAESGDIELKDADDAPLYDDAGNALSVTVHSPASKVYQQAQAEINRRRAERLRKNGNKLDAALENAKLDQIDFLCRITIRLNNFEYPAAKGDAIRALYEDDALGFIRDHVYTEASDWAAFTKGSAKS